MKTLQAPRRTARLHRERGASLIEYVLIAALVAVAAIAGLTAVGGSIGTKLESIGTSITGNGASGTN